MRAVLFNIALVGAFGLWLGPVPMLAAAVVLTVFWFAIALCKAAAMGDRR